jgi:hypothetical protein
MAKRHIDALQAITSGGSDWRLVEIAAAIHNACLEAVAEKADPCDDPAIWLMVDELHSRCNASLTREAYNHAVEVCEDRMKE